jgi:hypothetical protein
VSPLSVSHDVPGTAEFGASHAHIEGFDLQKLLDRNAVLRRKLQELSELRDDPMDVSTRERLRHKYESEKIHNECAILTEGEKMLARLRRRRLLLQTQLGAGARIAVLSKAVRKHLGIPESSTIKHLPEIRAAVRDPCALLEECGHLTAEGLKTKWEEFARRYPVIDDEDALDLIQTINKADGVTRLVPRLLYNITDPAELATLLQEAFASDLMRKFVSTSSDPDQRKADRRAFEKEQMTKLRAIAEAVVDLERFGA